MLSACQLESVYRLWKLPIEAEAIGQGVQQIVHPFGA
jgi:hypothetical protein